MWHVHDTRTSILERVGRARCNGVREAFNHISVEIYWLRINTGGPGVGFTNQSPIIPACLHPLTCTNAMPDSTAGSVIRAE